MRNLSIFYVDDDVENHFLITTAMQSVNKEVKLVSFHTGKELLDTFDNDKNNLPDLIMLDINIPGESGTGCLKILKQSSLLKAIPVIMYSSSNLQSEIDETMSLGASAYYVKADSFDAIKQQLREILRLIAK